MNTSLHTSCLPFFFSNRQFMIAALFHFNRCILNLDPKIVRSSPLMTAMIVCLLMEKVIINPNYVAVVGFKKK